MSSELPVIDLISGGEVPPTAPPTYDYDNRMLRDYKQNAAIQEITSPATPEIFNQDTAGNYQYTQPLKKGRRKN